MGKDETATAPSDPDGSGHTASHAAPRPPRPRRFGLWSVGVAVVSVGAGFLLVSGATASGGDDLRAERRTDLVDLIRAREADVAHRADQIAALDDQVTVDTSESTNESLAVKVELAAAAGLTPVEGPGVVVELDDAPRQVGEKLPDGVQADDLVVHQQDVQAVVNALWASGATAMQIMDQRLISTSAIRCVGNTLILQGRVYSPPFRIAAIGEPDRLLAGLDADPGVGAYRDWSDAVGLGYTETAESLLQINGYGGPVELTYAEGVR